METIAGIIEKLKKYIEDSTNYFKKVFDENNLDKIKKFVPAYVYFMKNYYTLLSQYEIIKNKKDEGEIPNLTLFKSLVNDINKTIDVLNTSNSNFNFSQIKIGSGAKKEMSLEKMSNWDENIPKKKMLSHLELWTGEKGEKAVTKALVNLKSNSNLLFDKVMHLHGINDYSNKIISSIFIAQIEKLFKYYIRHRNKYLPESSINEKRKLLFGEKVIINFSDDFMALDIRFGVCDFDSFTKTITTLVEGLDAVDVEILTRNHKTKKDKGEKKKEDVTLRQSLKKKIKEIAQLVGDDLRCNILKKNISFEASEIVPIIKSLHEAEKIITKEMSLIKENLKLQTTNANIMEEAIEELTGPDTAPCILHFIQDVRGMSLEEAKKLLIT